MFLIYMFFLILTVAYGYAKFRMYVEISKVNSSINSIQPKNVLYGMKKTQSFTIENSYFIQAHSSYTMDYFHYLFKKIVLFLGVKTSFFSYIIQISYKKTLLEIFEKNFISDHILVNKVEFKHDGSRTITCVITGAALRMYPETLPLFNFVPNFDPKINKIEHRHNFSHLVNGISAILIICFLTLGYLADVSLNLAKKATFKDQEILWSYLRYPVERNSINTPEYKFAQERIQEMLDAIQKPEGLENLKFKVHIIEDSDDIDMILLPAGNIVVTSAMVDRFDTENEITFTLAGAMYFYKDNYILQVLGKNYLSMHWILSHFGKDSIFGRMFVLYREFDNSVYDHDREQLADKFAIEQLNQIYGHVGGLESLRYKVQQEITNDHRIFEKHPVTQERFDAIDNYVKEKDYKYDFQNAVTFRVQNKSPKPDIVQVIPTQKSAQDYFNDNMNLFALEFSQLQNNYYSEFGRLDGILMIQNTTTKEDLTARIELMESVMNNLKVHNENYEQFFSKYQEQMNEAIQKIEDKDSRSLSKVKWNKEFDKAKEIVNFTLAKDADIIRAQKLILKFLISRYGSYQVKNGKIEFSTEKEKSDYRDLNDNLNQKISRKPSS